MPAAGAEHGGANGTRANSGATTPAAQLGLGLLHTLRSAMSASRAHGSRAADHQVGSRRVERRAVPVCSLHRVRPQGRNAARSRLEKWRGRMGAVPSREDRGV